MDHEELHYDFLVFMRKDACWTSMGVGNPNYAVRCDYHHHGESDECSYVYDTSGINERLMTPRVHDIDYLQS